MQTLQARAAAWVTAIAIILALDTVSAQPLRIYTAVELEFPTEEIRTYQLQHSGDRRTWVDLGARFAGTGSSVTQLLSTRGTEERFFRLQFTDLTPGLVAFYPFNGDANDATTNGNHGAAQNALLTTNRFGVPNAAYRLSGFTDSYIQVADSPTMKITDAITLAAWINFEQGGDTHPRIINKYVYELFTYETTENRRLAFSCRDVGIVASSEEVVHAGRWTFVAGSYDGRTLLLYVDGEPVAEAGATGPIPASDVEMNLGRNAQNNADNYQGAIDDVRIYNRALSAAEIRALFERID